MNIGVTYDFSADGKLVMASQSLKNPATYTIEGDQLTYKVGSVTMNATFKIGGDTLTLQIAKSDQVFTLKKK